MGTCPNFGQETRESVQPVFSSSPTVVSTDPYIETGEGGDDLLRGAFVE